MPRRPDPLVSRGPFKAEHLPSKSQYELDHGHPVLCVPTHTRGGAAQLNGGLVIRTDPAVRRAGVEVGIDLGGDTVRAPDVVVLAPDSGDRWATRAPPLAIEYADAGQDEPDLRRKIGQLLEAGTQAVWVVRLTGPRRVQVYTSDLPEPRLFTEGEVLSLPGVLANPVPVGALFDADQADRAALDNLLARFGYEHPGVAYEKGRNEGLRTAAVALLRARGVADPDARVAGLDTAGLLALITRV